MQVNRERLLELAIQGGATIDNAERVASAWEKWVKDAGDGWPTPFDETSSPVSHGIEERMALISPQLEALLGKLNAFSLKRTLCIENSTGNRFELAPSENDIPGIRDLVMEFPIELLSDSTWREVELKNLGKTEREIDWSRPQLVRWIGDTLILRTNGTHGPASMKYLNGWFEGTVVSEEWGAWKKGDKGEWEKAKFVYHGEIPQEQQDGPKTTGLSFLEAMEAALSGKTVERPNNAKYLFDGDERNCLMMKSGKSNLIFPVIYQEDILATDWQIIEP